MPRRAGAEPQLRSAQPPSVPALALRHEIRHLERHQRLQRLDDHAAVAVRGVGLEAEQRDASSAAHDVGERCPRVADEEVEPAVPRHGLLDPGDGSRVVIPNQMLVEGIVHNHSGADTHA